MLGKLPSGKDYQQTEQFTFEKSIDPRLLGIALAGPGAGEAAIQECFPGHASFIEGLTAEHDFGSWLRYMGSFPVALPIGSSGSRLVLFGTI